MQPGLLTLAVAAIVAMAVTTGRAHHGILGQFDVSKSVTLRGTIANVDWINPHPYVYLDVVQRNRPMTTWQLSTIPIAMMRKAGITKETLRGRPGERVTVAGHPALNGRRMAWMTRITYADGRYYALSED